MSCITYARYINMLIFYLHSQFVCYLNRYMLAYSCEYMHIVSCYLWNRSSQNCFSYCTATDFTWGIHTPTEIEPIEWCEFVCWVCRLGKFLYVKYFFLKSSIFNILQYLYMCMYVLIEITPFEVKPIRLLLISSSS